jgi:hypothetical protein
MNKYYTGVGSRSLPPDIALKINEIAKFLAKKGFILRSGGADGSDFEFEKGCDEGGGLKEIFLPWKGFNDNKSELTFTQEAFKLASAIHPVWNNLKPGAKYLHSRNCHQVLGQDLKTPSLFLVCYTENGEKKGGTATAITLAEQNNIPVFNLGSGKGLDKLRKWCKKNV